MKVADQHNRLYSDLTHPSQDFCAASFTGAYFFDVSVHCDCLMGAIKRRPEGVGIFPKQAAIVRRVGAILLEQNDEWTAQRARYMTMEIIAPVSDDPIIMLPARAA